MQIEARRIDESPVAPVKFLSFEGWWEAEKKRWTDWDESEVIIYAHVWKQAQENKVC